MVEETGLDEALGATELEAALDATLYADGETLVQTAGGTIQGDDPSVSVDRGAAIGRYTILDLLGAGAMGVVYTAYDPKLDRRVALKLLRIPREDNGTQMVARLIREAQALAKLNHPNVVTIHDCDTLGEHVYLAMELVEGTNLSRWLRNEERSADEILACFRQAGRGLGAAHQVGLVHRDFKPDNVLIGDDGRIRVADFGIARNADEDPLAGPSRVAEMVADLEAAESSTARLTQTGAVVGTPSYMSPEQHLGTRVDARCDQFAFAVALYEALYGVHPFTSKGYLDLRRRVLSGDLNQPPNRSDVPATVRAAILRGLEVLPDRRFETMEAMIEALEPSPPRRGLAIFAVLGLLIAVIAIGTTYALSRARSSCEGGERHLAGIWDAESRAAAERAFAATGRPYAGTSWENSAAALDRYSAAWVTMRREACEATEVYHEQSTALLDLRMACLDSRLRRLAAISALFREADSEVVLRAVSAADALPPLEACADTEALLREEPPADAETRAELERFDQLLAEAGALELASRYEASLGLTELALALAKELGSPRAEAQALAAKASTTDHLGRSEEAATILAQAALLAERAGADELRGRLWSHLALIEGITLGRAEEAERRLRHTTAILQRSSAEPLQAALLESRLGAVLSSQGRYDEAIATLERALVMLDEIPGEHSLVRLSTLNVMGSVYDLRGDPESALAHYRRALEIAERKVGPDHPESAKILNNIAVVEKGRGDYEAALADYRRVLELRRAAYDADHPEIGAALNNLGNLYLAMGSYADAISRYNEALEILSASVSPDSQLIGRLHYNVGVSHHLEGRFAEAVDSYQRAYEVTGAIYPEDHPELAYPLAGLGSALVELGRYSEALEPLERSLAIRSRKDVPPVDIGEIRFALARALPEDSRERARSLARLARTDYDALGDQATCAKIDAWLADPENPENPENPEHPENPENPGAAPAGDG